MTVYGVVWLHTELWPIYLPVHSNNYSYNVVRTSYEEYTLLGLVLVNSASI